jgi:hypothetical protein
MSRAESNLLFFDNIIKHGEVWYLGLQKLILMWILSEEFVYSLLELRSGSNVRFFELLESCTHSNLATFVFGVGDFLISLLCTRLRLLLRPNTVCGSFFMEGCFSRTVLEHRTWL